MAAEWRRAAQEIHDAAAKQLYDPSLGRFVRMINVAKDGTMTRDTTLDASMMGLVVFGMFSAHDPRIKATMEAVQGGTGSARRQSAASRDTRTTITNRSRRTSAPAPATRGSSARSGWRIITSPLPVHRDDLAQAATLIKWVTDHTLESGILAEQVHPYTGAPLSVSPLTWSHAALVVTIQAYVAKWTALTSDLPAQHGAPQSAPSAEPTIAPVRPMDASATEAPKPLIPDRFVPG